MSGDPFVLSRDPFGRLILTEPDGEPHVGVEPVRAFPLTEPGRWIALVDARGRELLMIEDLAALPGPLRASLEAELAEREFLPVITRIVRSTGDEVPCEWEVVTDRGPTRFTLETEDQLRRIGPHRVIVTDSRNLRYLIPDSRGLDAASLRVLDRYL